MSSPLVFLSIPGLRRRDLADMPRMRSLVQANQLRSLSQRFPAVTWPAQATMLTGALPSQHGIVANGIFHREKSAIEMWTAGNEVIERPQIWDHLTSAGRGLTSAAWFPMLSKRCGADYVCMPAPVHNPDGSESLWCYSKPTELYGELLQRLGQFPLRNFWGPLANITSTQWILDSAELVAERFSPDFFYIYVPHLDYAAQKHGPDSLQAKHALSELDHALGAFGEKMALHYAGRLGWIVATEYVIVPTGHVSFPNRVLREHGWLNVLKTDDGELLDIRGSRAFALVDHQFSHIYLRDSSNSSIAELAQLFLGQTGIDSVLDRSAQESLGIRHSRTGDLVLISTPDSWQAYYYWLDDRDAPAFARTVDIHRKPGYDPIELHLDLATKSIPLDASLNRGSHGAVSDATRAESIVILPNSMATTSDAIDDVNLCGMVLEHYGIEPPI